MEINLDQERDSHAPLRHYLDQRDNRHALARLCEGKDVLDAFCYSGGFDDSARSGA
ncbi:hypothetical protein T484DRAFT_1797962 [Baffinella frigidus]|nr:hypothetical protein T484DRAFT_1797962 [Cryptophyta sp. CCMP2293]